MQVQSIARGSSAVWVASGPGAAPRAEGDAAVYDRAPGVAERFSVSADGVELSYVFSRPLAGEGDLVVRLRVESPLRAEPGEHPGGVAFLGDDASGVRIGGVTGIDARGATTKGTLHYRNGHLELVLPAAFVDGEGRATP